MKRRALLAGVAAALAGCTTTGSGDSAGDTATPTSTPTAGDGTATPYYDQDDLTVDGVGAPITVTIEEPNAGTVVYERTFEERTVVEVLDLPPTDSHPGPEYVVTARWADGTSDTTTVEVADDGGLYPRSSLAVETFQGERAVVVVQA